MALERHLVSASLHRLEKTGREPRLKNRTNFGKLTCLDPKEKSTILR
jgi:hypothetical protein